MAVKKVPKGSIAHLKQLVVRLQGTQRPRLDVEDTSVLAAILTQEIIRRNIVESDRKQYEKMGIDMDELYKFPDWMKSR